VGYSIGVRVRSDKLKREMLAFLEAHHEPWVRVCGDMESEPYYSVGPPTGDLDYDRSKRVVGFNYGSLSGWERMYTSVLCRWIALQAGVRKTRFAKDVTEDYIFTDPVPVMTYDGHENWPVLLYTVEDARSLPKILQPWAVDKFGMPTGPRRFERSVLNTGFLPNLPGGMTDDEFETAWQRIEAESKKAGIDKPSRESGMPHEKWVDTRHDIMARHFKKDIRAAFKVMRAAMRRLDKAYQA
jgi:hypothetical protein